VLPHRIQPLELKRSISDRLSVPVVPASSSRPMGSEKARQHLDDNSSTCYLRATQNYERPARCLVAGRHTSIATPFWPTPPKRPVGSTEKSTCGTRERFRTLAPVWHSPTRRLVCNCNHNSMLPAGIDCAYVRTVRISERSGQLRGKCCSGCERDRRLPSEAPGPQRDDDFF